MGLSGSESHLGAEDWAHRPRRKCDDGSAWCRSNLDASHYRANGTRASSCRNLDDERWPISSERILRRIVQFLLRSRAARRVTARAEERVWPGPDLFTAPFTRTDLLSQAVER